MSWSPVLLRFSQWLPSQTVECSWTRSGGFWFHVVLILYAADEEQVDESTLSLSRVSS